MWRDFNKKIKKEKIIASDNRLRIAGAIIFILFLTIIWRIFNLQIIQHDLYAGLALRQHQVNSQLKAERGSIFLREHFGGEENSYLIATNKDFAFIYVVPKDIAEPFEMAEQFFYFFHKDNLREKFENEFKKEHQDKLNNLLFIIQSNESFTEEEKHIKIQEARRQSELDYLREEAVELREVKIQLKIEEEKELIIDNYLKILDKPGDPYEPFMDKVDDDTLLSLYAFLLSNEERSWERDELKRIQEGIYEKETGRRLTIPGLAFHINSYRFYPESDLASHILGFVGMDGHEYVGRYGLEEFFETELAGVDGHLRSERGSGNTIIVNDREYTAPVPGSDLVLTIDRSVQDFVCGKLKESVLHYRAESGTVIIADPKTGAIIAMCSFPSFDPNNFRVERDISVFNNPATMYQFEPGSTFKTITLAIALEEGKITPDSTYYDHGEIMISGWPRPIRNSDYFVNGGHGLVTMKNVLEQSLNTGTIYAMRQVGAKVFGEYLQKFGFGERTGIELGSESSGDIRNLLSNRIREIDAATASYGQGIAVTPLQMLMSYQVLANNGVLMKPYIVSEIINPDGTKIEVKPQEIRQVISAKAANTALAMLVGVVEDGHATGAQIPGYFIGGKTGTAQIATAGGYSAHDFVHIFTSVAPIDDPRFVILVKLDKPRGVRFAVSSTVPLSREITEFLLTYYRVPKSR